MTKLLRFAGVALLALTIGVFGCGDDADPVAPTVTVTVPTPPTPPTPPPPPLAVTMTPSPQTIGVGGFVVFAVGVSGGVAGEVATWTCASSDPSKATVSVIPAGCEVAAVAVGGVTITAVVTKGGATINAGAGLTITEDMVDPASLFIASIEDSDGDDEVLSGGVKVTLSVERGDQTFMLLSVLVDGVVADTLSFTGGASAVAAPQDEPAQQAVHPFVLSFNSAEYDAVTGEPTYLNGERTISAELMVAGSDEPITSGFHAREFANDDGVQVAVSGLGAGAMNSATGQMWYGGPAAMIEITAVPVLYSGGSVSSLGIGDFCGADAATDAEAPFVFTPTCKGTSVTEGDNPGETPEFTIAGTGVGVRNDDIFPLYLDFDGPPAPTFYPTPNGREDGWVNLTVDFLGEQKSSNKDGWLNYNADDAGVGGYQPVLRYAEAPSGGDGLEEALAAPILTPANLPGESKENAYCAVVSAVDLLGNESDLPDPDDDTCMTVAEVMATSLTGMNDDDQTPDVDESMQDVTFTSAMRGGVDITPPAVEFTAASLKADSTALSTGVDWVIHVSDRLGALHSDPLDIEISRRDAKTTKKLGESENNQAHVDSFTVANTSPSPRYAVEVGTAAVGYHTFTASVKDKAGNVSSSISRIALNDPTSAPESRVFLVPGGDSFTYEKTLVMTDNLSIKSYSAVLPLGDLGRRTLKTVPVDAYNAASLTTSRTVQETVKLPYIAIQAGTASAIALTSFMVSVSDQAGTASTGADGTDDLSTPPVADMPQVTGFRSGGGLEVVFGPVSGTSRMAKDPVKLTATVQMPDDNLDSPFSRVDFYGQIGNGATADLKFIGSVDTSAATTKLVDAPGRDWIYELVVSAEDYEEMVDDGDNNIVALGVSTAKGGSVAVSAVSDTTLDIDEN